jgi:regulatory protein
MKITSIETARGTGERVRLHLDDGATVELAHEIVLSAGARLGTDLSSEALHLLLDADLRWRARENALRLLSYRPRTESELRSRLLRKEIPAEVADACLTELREKHLLDDASFAEAFARDRVRLNPRGRRRVVQELRGRGVDPAIAASAVEGAMREEEVDEIDLARDAARRWRPRSGEDPERARRRLTGFLARRGFGADTVREVVEESHQSE